MEGKDPVHFSLSCGKLGLDCLIPKGPALILPASCARGSAAIAKCPGKVIHQLRHDIRMELPPDSWFPRGHPSY